jgi:hypothetical protein
MNRPHKSSFLLLVAAALGLSGTVVAYQINPKPGINVDGQVSSKASRDESWARILDHNVPLAERRSALAAIEADAASDDQHDLYLLGSLYHMGYYSGGVLEKQDLEKARLYLGNAATRGSILAMAKMAEINLAEHRYREAMNWAQIYAHYDSLLPARVRGHDGYPAELIKRVGDRFGLTSVDEVMPDVNSFIAAHDADIKAGADSRHDGESIQPHAKSNSKTTPGGRLSPTSGIADYLLAFKPDGSVASVWVLDAIPSEKLGLAMREVVDEMEVPKASEGAGVRYAWVPLLYSNGRFRERPMHSP